MLPEFPEHSTIIRVATSEILKSHDLLNIFLDGFWLALGSIRTLLLQRIDGKIGAYPSFKWTLILEFKFHSIYNYCNTGGKLPKMSI
jgi:hypothetical protein